MDVLMLSRIQFAATVMFHYLFPPLTIGMGGVLVYLEWKWLKTGDAIYGQAAKFWTKIFALNFAIGVATGIVMEFEFGTNWATYSRFVGDVFGSALAAEAIFAFFLESGFLAVLVFGWDRVSRRMHFFSTLMVALGSIFSSIWIVVANSWQQTPAGHHIVQMTKDGAPWFVDGVPVLRAEIVDFWELVFNPSTVHRLLHVLIGAFIMGGFFIMSIAAYYLLKRRHEEFARRSFRGALIVGTVGAFAALISGHFQARNVYRHQPAKLAAFEALYETPEGGAPMVLFGLPDDDAQRVKLAVELPGMLSFLVHDNFKEPVIGLDKFRPEDRPPVAVPFHSYHMMIMIGMFFIALTTVSWIWLKRGTFFEKRWLLWIYVLAVLPAVAGNQAGWVAAEVGRQPWIVHPRVVFAEDGGFTYDEEGYLQYHVLEEFKDANGAPLVEGLRTSDAISKILRAEQVWGSLILFSLIYMLLGLVWIFVLNRKIQMGPEPIVPDGPGAGGDGFLATASARQAHSDGLTGKDGDA